MTLEVTIKRTAGLQDAHIEKTLTEAIRKEILRSLLLLEKEVAKRTPVGATATLRTGVRGKLTSKTSGKVGVEGAAAKYAEIRELGRKPGRFPPVDAIALWIKRTPRGRAFLNEIAQAYSLKGERALKSAAFLKARAIAKRGYKGAFMFRNAEKAKRNEILKNFERTLREAEKKIG